MSDIDNLNATARQKALAVALNVAGACLTDDMIRLICGAIAGKSPTTAYHAWMTELPPEEVRSGIILPYTTMGSMDDFARRVHDIAVLVVGLMSLGGPDAYSASDVFNQGSLRVFNVDKIQDAAQRKQAMQAISATAAAIMKTPAPVGSRLFYESWDGPSPRKIRAVGEAITPMDLWTQLGVTPASLGAGFQGMAETKGTLPLAGSTSSPSGGTRSTPDADVVKSAEGAALQGWYKP